MGVKDKFMVGGLNSAQRKHSRLRIEDHIALGMLKLLNIKYKYPFFNLSFTEY